MSSIFVRGCAKLILLSNEANTTLVAGTFLIIIIYNFCKLCAILAIIHFFANLLLSKMLIF